MVYKYPKAKIYEIRCFETGESYIGSTTKSLKKRLRSHENRFKYYKQQKQKYARSFEILKNGNYKIFLLEKFPCDSLDELRKREGTWMQKIKCCNLSIPGRDRKEAAREAQKKYYHKNIEKFREKNKIVGKIDVKCECGCVVRYKHLARHKRTEKHKAAEKIL